MVSVGGFEPPISCVRGRHFRRTKLHAAENWSERSDSNRRSPASKAGALA